MLTNYWTPILPASLNGARRELENALNQVHQRQQSTGRVPLTAWEDDQRVYLELDVPGFGRDSIDIRFQEGHLHISGERPVPQHLANFRLNERTFGTFRRILSLPETIDPSAIEAQLQDGVLSITIGKKPESQPVKVEIKWGADQGKRIDN